jgi:hypothetical protein
MKVGQFGLRTGPVMASSNEFKITITRQGQPRRAAAPGHRPGADRLPDGAGLPDHRHAQQEADRHGVISVTMIHAGEATNVVPESCEIQGTVRTFTTEVLDLIERRMQTIAEGTCAAFEARLRVRLQAQLPADHQPRRRDRIRAPRARRSGGRGQRAEFEPTLGSEDFSYFLQEKPGCYFVIGNGDGAHRDGGHGLGPCMLHNPSYDFNDELIPLGATAWVRWPSNGWPGRPDPRDGSGTQGFAHETCWLLRAKLRRGARKFIAAASAAGREPVPHPHPLLGRDGEALAMDVARFGAADAPAVLIISSACHGVEGYCGSGVQGALLADGGFHDAAARAGVALLYVHALNPYGFSWLRRTTHENVDLNRNFQDFSQPLPRNAAYDRLAHLLVPPEWPPDAAGQGRLGGLRRRARRQGAAGRHLRRPVRASQGLFYGGRNPTWSHQTLRHVLQEHGRRCRRLAWLDLHTGLGPSGHGERIWAGPTTPRRSRARAAGGARR